MSSWQWAFYFGGDQIEDEDEKGDEDELTVRVSP
jgi:hypothetical protein